MRRRVSGLQVRNVYHSEPAVTGKRNIIRHICYQTFEESNFGNIHTILTEPVP